MNLSIRIMKTPATTATIAPTPTLDADTLQWEREVYAASPIGGDACRY
jgi:hypothetical protein